MDNLIDWQLSKKRKAEEVAKLAAEAQQKVRIPAKEETIQLNRLFGLPEQVTQVFALGKDGEAAVWWSYDPDCLKGVTGWEIWRYRLDNHQWQNKGYVRIDKLEQLQYIVKDLCNDSEYRFSVKALNIKGASVESELSNRIMVESPLPSGWYRYYDEQYRRHYYASVRTKRSSWTRPEKDIYFLQDELYEQFKRKELVYLKRLYLEDLQHFQCIPATQFPEIAREVGEKITVKRSTQLFKLLNNNNPQYIKSLPENSPLNEEEKVSRLYSWQQFIEAMAYLKRRRKQGGGSLFSSLTAPRVGAQDEIQLSVWQRVTGCWTRRQVRRLLGQGLDRNKMGSWELAYSPLLQRHFYRHKTTGMSSWAVPDEVKFFLPSKLEEQMLRVFDYGQIEEFKQHFSLLDLDSSGDLSIKEVRLLLDGMAAAAGQPKVSDNQLHHLFRVIDTNGSGTVEFDEFCFLALQLAGNSSTSNRNNSSSDTDNANNNLINPLASVKLNLSFTALVSAGRQETVTAPSPTKSMKKEKKASQQPSDIVISNSSQQRGVSFRGIIGGLSAKKETPTTGSEPVVTASTKKSWNMFPYSSFKKVLPVMSTTSGEPSSPQPDSSSAVVEVMQQQTQPQSSPSSPLRPKRISFDESSLQNYKQEQQDEGSVVSALTTGSRPNTNNLLLQQGLLSNEDLRPITRKMSQAMLQPPPPSSSNDALKEFILAQESRKSQKMKVSSNVESSKKSGKGMMNMLFNAAKEDDEDEDSDEYEDEEPAANKSTAVNLFKRMGSGKSMAVDDDDDEDKHGPACLCGCRRF